MKFQHMVDPPLDLHLNLNDLSYRLRKRRKFRMNQSILMINKYNLFGDSCVMDFLPVYSSLNVSDLNKKTSSQHTTHQINQ